MDVVRLRQTPPLRFGQLLRVDARAAHVPALGSALPKTDSHHTQQAQGLEGNLSIETGVLEKEKDLRGARVVIRLPN